MIRQLFQHDASRPDCRRFGRKWGKPGGDQSALMKLGQAASLGRNSLAKVVFPAPFGQIGRAHV
jgi:hypothetical protein